MLVEGLRGGHGGGDGDCVYRSCAPEAAGGGASGARGAGGEGRIGPEWGQTGRGVRVGRVAVVEGVEEKATRAHKPIVLLAVLHLARR